MRDARFEDGPARVLAVIAAGLLLAGSAAAQPPDAGGPPRPAFSAGLGIAVGGQPYEQAEDGAQIFPIPLISYRSERFEFAGKTASVSVADGEAAGVSWSLAGIADWRFQSYDEDDSPFLIGMEDRQSTLELGGRLRARRGPVRVTVSALGDVLGRHDGYEVGADIGYELADGRARSVVPSLGLRYQSSALADYYFGVRPEEELAVNCVQEPCPEAFFRPAYEVGDAWSPSVGLLARHSFSRRITFFGIARYDVLPDVVTDSPIVSGEGQLFGFGGLSYAFGG